MKKRIGILARNEGLSSLLRGLLMQWNYTLTEAPPAGDLLLAEEGCQLPEKSPNVMWLTTYGPEGYGSLSLPILVEELWRRLEARFHRPPRNHFRIAVRIPVIVRARDEAIPAWVGSLSDRGARLDFPREMVRGEELALEMALDDEPQSWAGRVIYVVPRGDTEGTGKSEIGVIFDGLSAERSAQVREHILWRYLERVRRDIPESLFREGLGFFRVPEAVLERLTKPAIDNP